VSARLGLDGVQSGHKDVYWFGQKWPYVQWVLLLLVLPCTRVLVVGVTSFRERERIPGLFGGGVCCLSEVCVPRFYVSCLKEFVSISRHESPINVALASPFIVFKRRARVTFVIKR
jgi:hypothetical protein